MSRPLRNHFDSGVPQVTRAGGAKRVGWNDLFSNPRTLPGYLESISPAVVKVGDDKFMDPFAQVNFPGLLDHAVQPVIVENLLSVNV